MAVDQRLKNLTDWRDDLETQMRNTTKAGATAVTDSDASVNRIALVSLRREWNEVNAMINRHLIQRGGGDPLFGYYLDTIRPGTAGTVYEDTDVSS